MINIQNFYTDNQVSLGFSTNPNIWPVEVLLHILNNMPEEGRIYFPEGEYEFNLGIPPIVISRPITINGSGNSGTILKLHKAIHIQSENVTFENLSIQRFSTFILTGALVIAASNTILRNLSIINQSAINTAGIFVENGASNWYIENVEIEKFQVGIKNNGNFGTCINTSAFNGYIGIEDNSSEGSTYIACRTYDNTTMGIQCLQKSLFSGCFATDKVEIKNSTLWIAGNLDYKQLSQENSGTIFTKNAFKQFNHKAESTHLMKNDADNDMANFYAGGSNNALFEFPSTSGEGNNWKLKFGSAEPEEIVYELGLIGQTSALSFSAGSSSKSSNTYMTPGKLGFPQGYYIGHESGFIHVTSDVAKPSLSEGRKGDRVMNRTPIVKPANSGGPPSDNNFMGWICVENAITGQTEWKGFGLLEE